MNVVGVEELPPLHPDNAMDPAASNGADQIDSVDVLIALSFLAD